MKFILIVHAFLGLAAAHAVPHPPLVKAAQDSPDTAQCTNQASCLTRRAFRPPRPDAPHPGPPPAPHPLYVPNLNHPPTHFTANEQRVWTAAVSYGDRAITRLTEAALPQAPQRAILAWGRSRFSAFTMVQSQKVMTQRASQV